MNPFAGLGAPPAPDAPAETRLAYLQEVVEGLRRARSPRVKPLQRRLTELLETLHNGARDGAAPETLAKQLATDLQDLQVQTFEHLLVTVNQVRATLRVKLLRGASVPEKADMQRLQEGLAAYAQGLRKMVAGMKAKDQALLDEARSELDSAAPLLEAEGAGLAPPS